MTQQTKKKQTEAPGVPSIEDLYGLYRHKLAHFFTARGLEREIAEDLCQETFFRFLRSGRTLESEDHARNLLFRIAQNLLIDHFRKHNGSVRVRTLSSEDLAEEGLSDLAAEESGPEDRLVSDETSHDINTVVSRLPLRYAQAIVLKEYEGLSYREIAARMEVSEKAVESLLHRARAQLKEELAEAGRKRGGWWSGILVGLRGLRDRAALKPLRHGLTLGLGSTGAAKGLVNVIAVILLLGSVAGTGVAAALSAPPDVASIVRDMEGPQPLPAEEEAAVRYSGGVTPSAGGLAEERLKVADAAPEMSEEETGPLHVDIVQGMPAAVADLLTGAGGSVRGAITASGEELDALLAGVGRIIGALVSPVAGVLLYAGVPSLVVDHLIDLADMDTVREITSGLIDTVVETTYILDETAPVLSALILDETAPVLSALPLPEAVPAAPLPSITGGEEGEGGAPAPAARGEGGGDTDPSAAPSLPAADTPDAEAGQPAGDDVPVVQDPVGEVVDLLLDATEAVGNLLPF